MFSEIHSREDLDSCGYVYVSLRSVVADFDLFKDVVDIIVKSMPNDVVQLFIEGLSKVKRIIFAKPFTKYGWFLALHQIYGITNDGEVIVYYNSEDIRWTASSLIHEVIHAALGIDRKSVADTIIDEALAYVASFKSGFDDLYRRGVEKYVESLCKCLNVFNGYELINMVIPSVLALRLVVYDLRQLVDDVRREGLKALLRKWLDTKPLNCELKTLATALTLINAEIDNNFKQYVCPSNALVEDVEVEQELEGIDKHYIEMIKILQEAAKNRDKAEEVLKPWLNQLKDIWNYVEAFLLLHPSTTKDG